MAGQRSEKIVNAIRGELLDHVAEGQLADDATALAIRRQLPCTRRDRNGFHRGEFVSEVEAAPRPDATKPAPLLLASERLGRVHGGGAAITARRTTTAAVSYVGVIPAILRPTRSILLLP